MRLNNSPSYGPTYGPSDLLSRHFHFTSSLVESITSLVSLASPSPLEITMFSTLVGLAATTFYLSRAGRKAGSSSNDNDNTNDKTNDNNNAIDRNNHNNCAFTPPTRLSDVPTRRPTRDLPPLPAPPSHVQSRVLSTKNAAATGSIHPPPKLNRSHENSSKKPSSTNPDGIGHRIVVDAILENDAIHRKRGASHVVVKNWVDSAPHSALPMNPTPRLNQVEQTDSTAKQIFDRQTSPNQTPPPPIRHLELLVHNVAHTDLVLALETTNPKSVSPTPPAKKVNTILGTLKQDVTSHDSPPQPQGKCPPQADILCRPRFSAFLPFSQNCLNSITKSQGRRTSTFASLYSRSDLTPRYNLVSPAHPMKPLPIGFKLDPPASATGLPLSSKELSQLRLRGRDAERIQDLDSIQTSSKSTPSGMYVSKVQFPLCSVLIPKFNEAIDRKYANLTNIKVLKVVILVSGVGTPRNWTHSVTGNSTAGAAKLMELFINENHPDIVVVRLHSESNIFRYDDNIGFVKAELLPVIESYRDAIATNLPLPNERGGKGGGQEKEEYNPDWRSQFHLTLSFADGSNARQYAIQASLRPYKPVYMHFWQLKTFWHEDKVCMEDIEVHTFEDMETDPPMAVEDCSQSVRLVAEEMKRFKEDFLSVAQEGPGFSDLRQFWMRKTKKPVLAVLLARTPDGGMKVFRGTNMEVSMPTGSLCAERNVIGTALASNPGLKRSDLIVVAVLAVKLDNVTPLCIEIDHHEQEASPPNLFDVEPEKEAAEAKETPTRKSPGETRKQYPISSSPPLSPLRRTTVRKYSGEEESLTGSPGDVPKARSKRRPKMTTIVSTDSTDLNPLKPCGACNEWLKKIAEPNPNFKVVTFTDSTCVGIYCSGVAFSS
ncbi:hypothetical protein TrST_g11272 [Triparma strigata]|uniref:Uncharacterized protein n=1 Tax=Triparma strigata TaxID=1606541 RepID=A0A9W7E1A2_9STRA|nr:hypothetical protein TrST_g11272 [Triparma strigata]